MVLHGNRKEGREELDSQREMEDLTAFVGIVAEQPVEGQDDAWVAPMASSEPLRFV
jgi:hypothetical protein